MTSEQELAKLRKENAELKSRLQDCINLLQNASHFISRASKVLEQVAKGKAYRVGAKMYVKIPMENK